MGFSNGGLASGISKPQNFRQQLQFQMKRIFIFWWNKISKKFSNNKAEIKFTISDLLNQRQIFYQNNKVGID